MRQRGVTLGVVCAATCAVLAAGPSPQASSQAPSTPAAPAPKPQATGVREAAWSPDGKRLAITWYDQIWTMAPDGKDSRSLFKTGHLAERAGSGLVAGREVDRLRGGDERRVRCVGGGCRAVARRRG